ncbi:DEAD/DEAH box helicase family protein [Streptomyces bohaiensis]|uniref:DEAD/DEAH box helicase family protein n=1 Tax=Streptomyces bohaiensis TaxID=1431344 RepID=UPI003B7D4415
MQRLGHTEGHAFEPSSGSGIFIGTAPTGTHMTGVELERNTAAISRHLYPEARILTAGLEEVSFVEPRFDVAIGNVPFGRYARYDREFNQDLKLSIHDHAILKAVTGLRPGGVGAFITSTYTLDRLDPAARERIHQVADFLGAVRLPARTHRAAAGTDVVTDVVLFRRRHEGAEPARDDWLTSTRQEIEGQDKLIGLNFYFTAHPEHLLGDLTVRSGPWGPQLTVISTSTDIAADLERALLSIADQAVLSGRGMEPGPGLAVTPPKLRRRSDPVDGALNLDARGRPTVVDQGAARLVELPEDQTAQLRQLIQLKFQTQALLDAEYATAEPGDTPELDALRTDLRQAWRDYREAHPPLQKPRQPRLIAPRGALERARAEGLKSVPESWKQRTAFGWFEDDPNASVVYGLEVWDDRTKTGREQDLLQRRVLQPRELPTSAANIEDAVHLAMEHDGGQLLVSRLASLLNVGTEEAENKLAHSALAFRDPEAAGAPWEPRNLYLAGAVRDKLVAAKRAAETDPTYQANVAALEKVQPVDLHPSQIRARVGAPWVPTEVYTEFLHSLGMTDAKVSWAGGTTWDVAGADYGDLARVEWGTADRSARQLFLALLRLTDSTIQVTRRDGDHTWVDADATAAAREKAARLGEAFEDWIWTDPTRAERLARIYNQLHNNWVLGQHSDAPLALPGLGPADWKMRPHQNAAIRRVIQSPGALLGHVVGAGKTATLAASAMELRRTGIARKPALVVPNHILGQFTDDFRELYPNARLLAISASDLGEKRRAQFMARIAGGDWDAVILSHSALSRVPLSRETLKQYKETELVSLRSQFDNARNAKMNSGALKRVENQLANAEARLDRLIENAVPGKGICLEQTGVDFALVDEVHEFKNLETVSVIPGAGIQGSAKATKLHIITEYLRRTSTSGRFACFATGTPIANGVAEMYVWMRFLAPERLAELGLDTYDAWAANYGEVTSNLEPSPKGDGYQYKARFAKFFNVPELLSVYLDFADVVTAEDMDLPVPKVRSGDGEERGENVIIEPTQEQIDFVKSLPKQPWVHKPGGVLKALGEGLRASLDMSLIVPHDYGLEPGQLSGSKLPAAAEKIGEIWRETKDVIYPRSKTDSTPQEIPGGFQFVFLDEGTPGGTSKHGMNLYAELRDLLVEQGIPREEIRFIHEASTTEKKDALFAACREGYVKVLIGSTQKMGTGTNAQDRAVALHHLSYPWRPADMAQRDGRIERQGNLAMPDIPGTPDDVRIIYYVTKQTFDEFRLNTLARKARMIAQIQKRDFTAREIEDLDDAALTLGMLTALASGDPAIMELAEATAERTKMASLVKGWDSEQDRRAEDLFIYGSYTNRAEAALDAMRGALEARTSIAGEDFAATVGEQEYRSRNDAGDALGARMVSIARDRDLEPGTLVPLGELGGHQFSASINYGGDGRRKVAIRFDWRPPTAPGQRDGRGQWAASDINEATGRGAIASLESALKSLPSDVERLEADLARGIKARDEAKANVKPRDQNPYRIIVRSKEREERYLSQLIVANEKTASRKRRVDALPEGANEAEEATQELEDAQAAAAKLRESIDNERALQDRFTISARKGTAAGALPEAEAPSDATTQEPGTDRVEDDSPAPAAAADTHLAPSTGADGAHAAPPAPGEGTSPRTSASPASPPAGTNTPETDEAPAADVPEQPAGAVSAPQDSPADDAEVSAPETPVADTTTGPAPTTAVAEEPEPGAPAEEPDEAPAVDDDSPTEAAPQPTPPAGAHEPETDPKLPARLATPEAPGEATVAAAEEPESPAGMSHPNEAGAVEPEPHSTEAHASDEPPAEPVAEQAPEPPNVEDAAQHSTPATAAPSEEDDDAPSEQRSAVDGAPGYQFSQVRPGCAHLYDPNGAHVGTATRFGHGTEATVDGMRVRGRRSLDETVERMAKHHRAISGDLAHRPELDQDGRDPVWILHNSTDTLVHGISTEDETTRHVLWSVGGFKPSRRLGGAWYLPRTWKPATRQERVSKVVKELNRLGRPVQEHRTPRPDRGAPPSLNIPKPTPAELDLTQIAAGAPYQGNSDELRTDLAALNNLQQQWRDTETATSYLEDDRPRRIHIGIGPTNPVAHQVHAFHQAVKMINSTRPEEMCQRFAALSYWTAALAKVVPSADAPPLRQLETLLTTVTGRMVGSWHALEQYHRDRSSAASASADTGPREQPDLPAPELEDEGMEAGEAGVAPGAEEQVTPVAPASGPDPAGMAESPDDEAVQEEREETAPAPVHDEDAITELVRPVPSAPGYETIVRRHEQGSRIELYGPDGTQVGEADQPLTGADSARVAGNLIDGGPDEDSTIARMAEHHRIVAGDRIHRPQLDEQGRDPVWVHLDRGRPVVLGVSAEDHTARAFLAATLFAEAVGEPGSPWYLKRHASADMRRWWADRFIEHMAKANRKIAMHTEPRPAAGEAQLFTPELPGTSSPTPAGQAPAADRDTADHHQEEPEPAAAPDGGERENAAQEPGGSAGAEVMTPDGPGTVMADHEGSVLVTTDQGTRVWSEEQIARGEGQDQPIGRDRRVELNAADVEQAQTSEGIALGSGHFLRDLSIDEGHGLVVDEDGTTVGWVRGREDEDGRTTWQAQVAPGGPPEGLTFRTGGPAQGGVPAIRAARLISGWRPSPHLKTVVPPPYAWGEATLTTAQVRHLRELDISGATYPNGEPLERPLWVASHRRYSLNPFGMETLADAALEAAIQADTTQPEERRRQKVLLNAVTSLRQQAYAIARQHGTLPPPDQPDPYRQPYRETPLPTMPEPSATPPAPEQQTEEHHVSTPTSRTALDLGYSWEQYGDTSARVYAPDGTPVGGAVWVPDYLAWEAKVGDDAIGGKRDLPGTLGRIVQHHSAVYGDLVHLPAPDDDGRDPVWVEHNEETTLVHGITKEDVTGEAVMAMIKGFRPRRKEGVWYLPTWKEPKRRERVEAFVEMMSRTGRHVTQHPNAEARTANAGTLVEPSPVRAPEPTASSARAEQDGLFSMESPKEPATSPTAGEPEAAASSPASLPAAAEDEPTLVPVVRLASGDRVWDVTGTDNRGYTTRKSGWVISKPRFRGGSWRLHIAGDQRETVPRHRHLVTVPADAMVHATLAHRASLGPASPSDVIAALDAQLFPHSAAVMHLTAAMEQQSPLALAIDHFHRATGRFTITVRGHELPWSDVPAWFATGVGPRGVEVFTAARAGGSAYEEARANLLRMMRHNGPPDPDLLEGSRQIWSDPPVQTTAELGAQPNVPPEPSHQTAPPPTTPEPAESEPTAAKAAPAPPPAHTHGIGQDVATPDGTGTVTGLTPDGTVVVALHDSDTETGYTPDVLTDPAAAPDEEELDEDTIGQQYPAEVWGPTQPTTDLAGTEEPAQATPEPPTRPQRPAGTPEARGQTEQQATETTDADPAPTRPAVEAPASMDHPAPDPESAPPEQPVTPDPGPSPSPARKEQDMDQRPGASQPRPDIVREVRGNRYAAFKTDDGVSIKVLRQGKTTPEQLLPPMPALFTRFAWNALMHEGTSDQPTTEQVVRDLARTREQLLTTLAAYEVADEDLKPLRAALEDPAVMVQQRIHQMPQSLASVDADLEAGSVLPEQAQLRKSEIARFSQGLVDALTASGHAPAQPEAASARQETAAAADVQAPTDTPQAEAAADLSKSLPAPREALPAADAEAPAAPEPAPTMQAAPGGPPAQPEPEAQPTHQPTAEPAAAPSDEQQLTASTGDAELDQQLAAVGDALRSLPQPGSESGFDAVSQELGALAGEIRSLTHAQQELDSTGVDGAVADHLATFDSAFAARAKAQSAAARPPRPEEELRQGVRELKGSLPARLWRPISALPACLDRLQEAAKAAAGSHWEAFRQDVRWQGLWRTAVSRTCTAMSAALRTCSAAVRRLPGVDSHAPTAFDRLAHRADVVAQRQRSLHFPTAAYGSRRESAEAARAITQDLRTWLGTEMGKDMVSWESPGLQRLQQAWAALPPTAKATADLATKPYQEVALAARALVQDPAVADQHQARDVEQLAQVAAGAERHARRLAASLPPQPPRHAAPAVALPPQQTADSVGASV